MKNLVMKSPLLACTNQDNGDRVQRGLIQRAQIQYLNTFFKKKYTVSNADIISFPQEMYSCLDVDCVCIKRPWYGMGPHLAALRKLDWKSKIPGKHTEV